MTSFAFILGVLPLVFPSGAGAASRHALGTAVFGGMIAATALGIFFIPLLYKLVQDFSNFFSKKKDGALPAPAATDDPAKAKDKDSETDDVRKDDQNV
jgi:hypothetical protein